MEALLKIRQAGFALGFHGGDLSVIPASQLTLGQRDFIKQRKAEIVEALNNEAKIRAWLDYIGETDQELIAELFAQCTDKNALDYFLKRSQEVPTN